MNSELLVWEINRPSPTALSPPTPVLIAPVVGRHPPGIAPVLRCLSPPVAARESCCLELIDLCECN